MTVTTSLPSQSVPRISKKRGFPGGEESPAKRAKLSPSLGRTVSMQLPGTPKTPVLRQTRSCFDAFTEIVEKSRLTLFRKGCPILTIHHENRLSLSSSGSGSTSTTELIPFEGSSEEVKPSVFQIAALEHRAVDAMQEVLDSACIKMHKEALSKKEMDNTFRLMPPWGETRSRELTKRIAQAKWRLAAAHTNKRSKQRKENLKRLQTRGDDRNKFKLSKDVKGVLVDVTLCAIQGRRSGMEDAHVIEDIDLTIAGKLVKGQVIALFDGHGGPDASNLCAQHLVVTLKTAVEKHAEEGISKHRMSTALYEVCAKIDEMLLDVYLEKKKQKIRYTPGTTFACALILDGKIWTVNLGDSRLLLIKKDGTPVPLTFDQKPEDYKKLIKKRGGQIFQDGHGIWRLNGSYAVQRTAGALSVAGFLGDHYLRETSGIQGGRPVVDPTITCLDIDEGDRIIVACDGLWDVVSLNKIAELSQTSDRRKLAEGSAYGAYEAGSTDNISVIVADYKGLQEIDTLQNTP